MEINIKMSDVIKAGAGLYLGWTLAKNVTDILTMTIDRKVREKRNENS